MTLVKLPGRQNGIPNALPSLVRAEPQGGDQIDGHPIGPQKIESTER